MHFYHFIVYQLIHVDLWIGSDLILTSEGCSITTIIFVPGESTRQRVSPPTILWRLDLLVYLGHTIIWAYDRYFDFLHIFQPIIYNITLWLTCQNYDVIGSKAVWLRRLKLLLYATTSVRQRESDGLVFSQTWGSTSCLEWKPWQNWVEIIFIQ